MSLVVAAYNSSDIVIASDSLNKSTKTGSLQLDASIEKVKQINPQLAYMITGTYASDKLQFMKDFAAQTQSVTELDTAFWSLFELARQSMVTYASEGFRIGLAGFNAGIPSFKSITVVHGRPLVAEGATANYYLSGESDPVVLSEQRIKASRIVQHPTTAEIANILSDIVRECIAAYPATLGGPVETLVLSN